ncbi:hypothetical protein RND81_11G220200 [Saponaria officinalis]|uniref:Uncharacterized protein n=1 Tax=Saponaria officinalis TaxID=3572 RepID=A0AAW1HQT1_SAPOF
MARIHLIYTLALLFTLLTQMLSTEGRDIKPSTMKIAPQKVSTDIPQTVTYDNNFPSLKPTHTMQKNSFKVSSSHVNKVESNGQDDIPNLKSLADNRLKAPGHSNMHPGHAKKGNNKPNSDFPLRSSTSSSSISAFAMVHENDFPPTAPGISPGASHTDTNKNDKEEPRHCLSDKCTDNFRPTAPGDSPGAGHSFVNNESKASEHGKRHGVAHTQAGQTDDDRPTAASHSPGLQEKATLIYRITESPILKLLCQL